MHSDFGPSGMWKADMPCMVEFVTVLTRIHLVVKNKTDRKLVPTPHGLKKKKVRKKKSSLITAVFTHYSCRDIPIYQQGNGKIYNNIFMGRGKNTTSIWFLTVWPSLGLQNVFTLRTWGLFECLLYKSSELRSLQSELHNTVSVNYRFCLPQPYARSSWPRAKQKGII